VTSTDEVAAAGSAALASSADAAPALAPTFTAGTAEVAVVDAHGTLFVLDPSGTVLASASGHATDLVASGDTIVTFEPATEDAEGALRFFVWSTSESALVEGPPRPHSAQAGGLLTTDANALDRVIAWERAERASALVATANDIGGLAIGLPSAARAIDGEDGSHTLELLITASGAPRIDRLRLTAANVRLDGDSTVDIPADVEARMVDAPGPRFVVTLENGSITLRDEEGGLEIGPSVAPKSTLEAVAASEGRLALLLNSPGRIFVRGPEGEYVEHLVVAPVANDPYVSHRLALTPHALWAATGTSLLQLALDESSTTKTASAALEQKLEAGVAVVAFDGKSPNE
jgi:hypothetical protein